MPTPHISSEKEDVAKVVLMPGDPLRAKYIADKFLTDVKLVNEVRNNYGFTGFYKGNKVTVFSSGMGIPSIGIYAYELFKFYDVDKIIRIGSCGSNHPDVKLLDVVLATSAYTLNPYAKLLFDEEVYEAKATESIINDIITANKNLKSKLVTGEVITSDVFDVYADGDKFIKNFPSDRNFVASEMEAFCLLYLATKFNKEAATLLTVVDSKYDDNIVTSKQRETSLDDMIILALESSFK